MLAMGEARMANTPWVGDTDDKLYLQSGQFSATMKTSRAVGTIDTLPRDIETSDVTARLGGGAPAAPAGQNQPSVIVAG